MMRVLKNAGFLPLPPGTNNAGNFIENRCFILYIKEENLGTIVAAYSLKHLKTCY
jgi:hypothetical protein